MHVRLFVAAAALLFAGSAEAADHDLTVVLRGDALRTALQGIYFHPFTTATDIAIRVESWDGGLDTLRTQAKAPDNAWDIVMVDPGELSVGCNEGLFEKLDWPAIGGKDHYTSAGVSDCGVGALVVNLVLAWDKDKFPATPAWADFWDVAKYPGKRGLRQGPRGNLEIALLADGVAPADVYKTLATAEGVDRAFRKLDQLKPYIVWWQTEADAVRILGSGDVLMTSAPSGRVVSANRRDHRNFGIQWAASLYEIQSWAILKGSSNARIGHQLLYVLGSTGMQTNMLRTTGESGIARGINDGLPPEIAANSPTTPANLSAGLRTDAGFWNDNLARLRQRFEAWQSAR
jgi:putative spermidine/putrescine transport system substrate-binding protein